MLSLNLILNLLTRWRSLSASLLSKRSKRHGSQDNYKKANAASGAEEGNTGTSREEA
jgi:hypothetical protein